ncbi:hypothetical protein [Flavobacterium taihuense]|uniref:Methyltransferase n=1 Tax=Flavobacterium taihuense TaxID=2857508 RepID=A0ABS6XUM3_9FLAO|nr:hypothetical protein [Flavobacterium taihuense]MBW4360362.1 hypothetical protein [Flavobacterium taihuense]
MINKIKSIINEFRVNNKQIRLKLSELESQNRELEWAHIYHDSIRGKKWIEELPLNVGRWAGNYSFFYVLNRILSDYMPEKILDLGLGESSKFISAYIENYLFESSHIIVEQDKNWIDSFQERFKLSTNSKIIHCPIAVKEVNGFNVKLYQDFNEKIIEKFDLYIIDGPFGSERFSRYDIISLVERITEDDQFIIIMDDTDRKGERDTLNEIKKLLSSKEINYYIGEYTGNKIVTIIASEKYKFSISL